MAKGYRQEQGVNYDETLSLIAMLKFIRILLAVDAHCDYEISQMDMKTTFHKRNLSKDVCMTQPEVFTPINGNKVCKL